VKPQILAVIRGHIAREHEMAAKWTAQIDFAATLAGRAAARRRVEHHQATAADWERVLAWTERATKADDKVKAAAPRPAAEPSAPTRVQQAAGWTGTEAKAAAKRAAQDKLRRVVTVEAPDGSTQFSGTVEADAVPRVSEAES
jgi:hypothetical protein